MVSKIAKWMAEHPSSIREIMSLVAEYKKHPEKFPRELIYLAGGWPQDMPPRILIDKLKEVITSEDLIRMSASYSPTIGYPDLLEAIVQYEKEVFSRSVEPEEIVFGLGSSEQTGALFISLLDPGDELILTAPGYLNYERQARLELLGNVNIRYWRVIKDGVFSPDLDELQSLITKKTKAVVITTPGNPDGQVWTDEIIDGLSDLAEEKDFYILIDVAYRAFIFYEKPKYFSRKRREKEIYICTLSKELRIPGWRASYVLLPYDLARYLNTIEQARTLAPCSLVQTTLIKLFNDKNALSEVKKFYEEGTKKYEKAAKLTVDYLSRIPQLKILEPQGGFYVFFDVSYYEKSSRKLCNELLQKYQVALTPGIDFNGFEGWIRLSFAPVVESQEKLIEGLERMIKFFEEKRR